MKNWLVFLVELLRVPHYQKFIFSTIQHLASYQIDWQAQAPLFNFTFLSEATVRRRPLERWEELETQVPIDSITIGLQAGWVLLQVRNPDTSRGSPSRAEIKRPSQAAIAPWAIIWLESAARRIKASVAIGTGAIVAVASARWRRSAIASVIPRSVGCDGTSSQTNDRPSREGAPSATASANGSSATHRRTTITLCLSFRHTGERERCTWDVDRQPTDAHPKGKGNCQHCMG